jgi:hypothetical protein
VEQLTAACEEIILGKSYNPDTAEKNEPHKEIEK